MGLAVDRNIQLDLASKYCKTNIWLMNLTTMALIVYLRVAVFNSNKTLKQKKNIQITLIIKTILIMKCIVSMVHVFDVNKGGINSSCQSERLVLT